MSNIAIEMLRRLGEHTLRVWNLDQAIAQELQEFIWEASYYDEELGIILEEVMRYPIDERPTQLQRYASIILPQYGHSSPRPRNIIIRDRNSMPQNESHSIIWHNK